MVTLETIGGTIDKAPINGNFQALNDGKSEIPTVVTQSAPTAITIADNTEYVLTNVSALAISYPASGRYSAFITLTTASEGSITITFPDSQYIPAVPTFGNGQKWLIGIDNGVVIAQKAVSP